MCMKFLMNKKLDLEQLDKIRLLQRSYSAICEVNKTIKLLLSTRQNTPKLYYDNYYNGSC